MLEKGFHTVFDVLVTHEAFLSLTVFAFEGEDNALLYCHNRHFFPKQLSYLRPIFVNLSTEKHLHCQQIVAFEKKTQKLKLKEDEIIGGEKESYFRRFFGPLHGKQEISKVLYSFLFGQ